MAARLVASGQGLIEVIIPSHNAETKPKNMLPNLKLLQILTDFIFNIRQKTGLIVEMLPHFG